MNRINVQKEVGGDTTYFNEKRNCWIAQFSIYVNGVRKRPSASGQTEQEALLNLQKKKLKLLSNPQIITQNTKMTFGKALESMVKSLQGTIEDQTMYDYNYRISVWKSYQIANKKIHLVTKDMLQKTIIQIADERTLCESTCSKLISIARRALDFAVEEGEILRNPIEKKNSIKIPICATETEDVQPLSSQECERVLDVLEASPRLKPIIQCMLYSGLRIGEVLALTWENIDFNKNKIYVRHSVKRKKVKQLTQGETSTKYVSVIGRTKTKSSIRNVPLSENLKACLQNWKMVQPYVAKSKEPKYDLVFPTRQGKIQSFNSYSIGFIKFLEKHGLSPQVYHSRVFRHTFASYLVKAKIDPKTLQSILGHKDITTTLNYYVNSDMESQNIAVQKIDFIINNISSFSFEVAEKRA